MMNPERTKRERTPKPNASFVIVRDMKRETLPNTLTTTWSSERPGRTAWTPLWRRHDIIAGYLRTTASAFWKCTFRESKRFECTRPAGQGSFISRVGTNTYGATRPASLSLIHERPARLPTLHPLSPFYQGLLGLAAGRERLWKTPQSATSSRLLYESQSPIVRPNCSRFFNAGE